MPNEERKQINRRYPRVTAFLPVIIRTQSGETFQGEVETLSMGGASIRCTHNFSGGERVVLELRFAGLKSSTGGFVDIDAIEDEGIIRAEEMAEVRWQKDGIYFGVQFTNLSRDTKRFLQRLVKFFNQLEEEG